jgi:hypothetical protein
MGLILLLDHPVHDVHIYHRLKFMMFDVGCVVCFKA